MKYGPWIYGKLRWKACFFCDKKSVCQALLQGQAASAGCVWTFHFWNRWSREVILRLNAFERLVDYPWKIGLVEQLGLFLRHLGCQIDTNDIKDLGKVVLEKGQQGVGSAWREVDVKSVGWKQWAKPSQNNNKNAYLNCWDQSSQLSQRLSTHRLLLFFPGANGSCKASNHGEAVELCVSRTGGWKVSYSVPDLCV